MYGEISMEPEVNEVVSIDIRPLDNGYLTQVYREHGRPQEFATMSKTAMLEKIGRLLPDD